MMMLRLILLLVLILITPRLSADPIISEFLASNDSELADEDGDFPDWIEIHNPDAVAVDMAGWHLTDNSTNLNKWTFPSVSIPAGGYLVVFASNKDRAVAGSELHTDFKLSSAGEYLALVKPDGVTKASEFDPYPKQSEDVSYGINNSTVLVDQHAALRYSLVAPTSTWTQHNFDDSAWRGARSSDVGVIITECETGGTDAVELQNVSGASVDTTGWYMAFGGGSTGINEVEPFLALLPNSMASGGVQTFTENIGGLGNILWPNSGTRGWAMLLNASDEVMDFVVWGYTEAQVRSLNINQTISGKLVQVTYTDDLPWSGAGVGSGSNFANNIIRSGSRDVDTAADWSFTGTSTLGSQNTGISRPFTSYGQAQAQAGIGYEETSGYEDVLLTNIDSETSQVWVRFLFDVADPSVLSALTLRLRYDDGFQAFINGVAVANENDAGTISQESVGFVDFDLNAHLSDLRVGQNVLAVRLINQSLGSSDLLLVPELVASLPSGSQSFVYLTNPTPGVANQGGALNPGPFISEVTENPVPPVAGQGIPVTARVQARADTTVQSVVLRYRVDFGGEATLAMRDDGAGGDAVAGDGVYSATIPASAYGARDMVRWTVVAGDSEMEESRMPLQADTSGKSQSPQYYGTVVVDPAVTQNIPLMQWFSQNEAASRTRTGARASVFYLGRFYDNIFVRQRGGFSNGSSQKFDFNKDFPFYANDNLTSVGEVNMNANGQDASYVRQPLAFQFHQRSGGPGCDAFPVQMLVNGSFDRIGILIEQVDEDYLKRFGYDDKQGELFKIVHHSSTAPTFDSTAGAERKTGDKSDLAPIQGLVDSLKLPSATARTDSFYDNFDIQEYVNYMAARCLLQQSDDIRKNFYLYKDAAGDGRWRIFPWDLDFIFGLGTIHGVERMEHPFFGNQQFRSEYDPNEWNRLYNVASEDVTIQRLYLRRIRTLMDAHMKSSATGSWFESKVDEIYNSMLGLPGPSSSNWSALRNTEIPERRSDLYTQFTASIPGMSVVIPGAQPSNPSIAIDAVDFNPVGGDQDMEYIRITNSESTEIDISGWNLSDGVGFSFPPGTVIPRNGSIYVSPNLAKFANRSLSPKAGERRLVTGPYQGHLSSFGEQIVLKNESGTLVQTYSYLGDPSPAQENLVISQLHYHPLANSDAEFIEITNVSTTATVDLAGVHFTRGVDFTFTGSSITLLGPGEKVLVVKDQDAFELVYGTSVSSRIAGVFANGSVLDNSGETIKLEDSTNSTIHNFTYSPEAPWPVTNGRSLVLLDPTSLPEHDLPANWTLSGSVDGSPAGVQSLFNVWLASRGQTDPLADPDFDGWNELLTYAFGRDLAGTAFVHRAGVEVFNIGGMDGSYAILETTVRQGVTPTPQTSLNLSLWKDAVLGSDVILVSDIDNGDGTRTHKYRFANPISPGEPPVFLRLKVVN